MKAKLFAKLKQAYSPLGLAEEILLGRADSLAKTGFVTDDNLDLVVAAQKDDLEGLQKANDKRVTDALEKQRQKIAEETQKKEAEQKKLAEEKKAKEAEEQKARQKEEESKNAEEETSKKEAERAAALEKEIEELKAKGIPDSVVEYFRAQQSRNESERMASLKATLEKEAAFEKRLEEIVKGFEEKSRKSSESYTALQKDYETLRQNFDTLTQENEANKAAKAKADREAFILDTAKSLGIPQWRTDEGFVIPEDANNDTISEILNKTAENIRTANLPSNSHAFPKADNKPSAEEIAAYAKALVH